jgi:hypothetical protein
VIGEDVLAKKLRKPGAMTASKADNGGISMADTEESATAVDGVSEEMKKKSAKKALRDAVKDEVKRRSVEIAKAIVDRMIAGDMRSATMMMSLIENRTKSNGKAKRKTRSRLRLVDLPPSEPECVDESPEMAAEVGEGGLEPESTSAGGERTMSGPQLLAIDERRSSMSPRDADMRPASQ